jgi:hypothetical protein
VLKENNSQKEKAVSNTSSPTEKELVRKITKIIITDWSITKGDSTTMMKEIK